MNKELCIVHANCQGEPLIERLMTSPQFAARYHCELYTNYIRQPVPPERLGRCALFLYQHLGPEWNELASAALLAALPASAQHLCIPNMFHLGYWPLWSGRPGFDYRCDHLDEFLALGRSPEETMILFLRSDPAARYDLPGLIARSVALERKKEERTPIKYLDMVLERSRSVRLFHTINHPGRELMDHAARGVLAQLGLAAPDKAALARLDEPFQEFELPINPKVARFFGWDFATPETQYQIYGRQMNFARYATNYIMAARAGISDFIGYLQGVHSAI
ncbi:hypothetical protein GKC30_03030 [Pseudodesulfovibrio sp. F-1]|uniref:Polysaccharide biosynthesis enzyme WcbI domain-containing protein n=1 Tax=Pseudodesulfovibrio alkaliphilus TaxID=2661613 RepID=A0A7K1KKJ1_9BACT|nr:WcbI family polysaccharide biosynthesis putative acetyltransferase [Pseudodesulfovibrio alkaliphilus]MUM76604.1 hypothetical protein [Pseudodesulfovibrio alkaliphilus]